MILYMLFKIDVVLLLYDEILIVDVLVVALDMTGDDPLYIFNLSVLVQLYFEEEFY